MTKYIVDCTIKKVADMSATGDLLLKPVVQETNYARIFDTEEQVRAFLLGEVLPVRGV
jgi:hypothetical protein